MKIGLTVQSLISHTRSLKLTHKAAVANRDLKVRSSGTMPNRAILLFRWTLS
jgi:hypothetical protein